MRKTHTLALGIGLLGWLGCATSQPIDTQTSDTVITSKIDAKLAADPETNYFGVDVDTLNGKVFLRGMVENETARREAEHLARRAFAASTTSFASGTSARPRTSPTRGW